MSMYISLSKANMAYFKCYRVLTKQDYVHQSCISSRDEYSGSLCVNTHCICTLWSGSCPAVLFPLWPTHTHTILY